MRRSLRYSRSTMRHQGGFILAMGMLMMAVLALIGTMALNSASFQRTLSANVVSQQEIYYLATVAQSIGLNELRLDPDIGGNTSTIELGSPFRVGSFSRSQPSVGPKIYSSSALVGTCKSSFVYKCMCPVQGADCIAFYVEKEDRNLGPALPGEDARTRTAYVKLSATAIDFHSHTKKVSIYVAVRAIVKS